MALFSDSAAKPAGNGVFTRMQSIVVLMVSVFEARTQRPKGLIQASTPAGMIKQRLQMSTASKLAGSDHEVSLVCFLIIHFFACVRLCVENTGRRR